MVSVGLLIISCSNDESKTGSLSVSAKATLTNPTNKSTVNRSALTGVVVNKFLLNVTEFELDLDIDHQDDGNESWDDDGFFNYNDEFKLKGPFILNLMQGQISFLSVDVPNGKYEEIEFKFAESTVSNSELFGKSILIEGTINNKPFIFWHDFTGEVEVDFDDPQFDILIQNNANSLVINFDLASLFNSVSDDDLYMATDGNMDGVIEISPYDTDSNNVLANTLKDKFKMLIDLLND